MSLAIADYDGDGWLDLYVANYRFHTIADTDARFSIRPVDGKLTVASINNKPLTDPEWKTDEEKPWVIGRQRLGRIAIANSDAGHEAETQTAIDEAHRAVQELLKT